MINELLVRRGQELTARLWNAFWAERRRNRLIAGPGVKLAERADGVLINFDAQRALWLHPWKASLAGEEMRLRPGFINETIEPTIAGVPLSGNAEKGIAPPVLKIDLQTFGEGSRSYVGALIATGEDGRVTAAEIVQRAKVERYGPFWPLVVLYNPAGGTLQKFQHSFFNLRHYSRALDGGAVRHYFAAQP